MHDFLFFLHILGLVMGIPASFGFLYFEIASAKMDNEQACKFTKDILPLKKIGYAGLALVIISGGILISPYWSEIFSMPVLLTKLIFFILLLTILIVLSTYTRQLDNPENKKSLQWIMVFGGIALLLAVAILFLAVVSFH